MRAYFFGNMYLSSIQQGIQGEHAMTSMFLKYRHDPKHLDTMYAWAEHFKTSIYLNGGYADNLQRVHDEICDIAKDFHDMPFKQQYLEKIGIDKNSKFPLTLDDLVLPFSCFHEEKASLNGALTSVAVILPEPFYVRTDEVVASIEDNDDFGIKLRPHERMIKLLSEFRLAS